MTTFFILIAIFALLFSLFCYIHELEGMAIFICSAILVSCVFLPLMIQHDFVTGWEGVEVSRSQAEAVVAFDRAIVNSGQYSMVIDDPLAAAACEDGPVYFKIIRNTRERNGIFPKRVIYTGHFEVKGMNVATMELSDYREIEK